MTDEEIETFEEAMDEQTKIERWIVTLWCPLAPRLFTPRFRQGDGTLVAHEKAGYALASRICQLLSHFSDTRCVLFFDSLQHGVSLLFRNDASH
jgi:hypothetical protein